MKFIWIHICDLWEKINRAKWKQVWDQLNIMSKKLKQFEHQDKYQA